MGIFGIWVTFILTKDKMNVGNACLLGMSGNVLVVNDCSVLFITRPLLIATLIDTFGLSWFQILIFFTAQFFKFPTYWEGHREILISDRGMLWIDDMNNSIETKLVF